jgi:hypothetical protein
MVARQESQAMRMTSRHIIAALFAATGLVMTGSVALAQPAGQASPVAGTEAAIPFVDMGGIRDWQAADDSHLYVQDIRRNWYLAKLSVPCTDLPLATAIGFETKGLNQLDRFGTVIVRGQHCPMSSFVASGPPPAKARP